MPAYSTLRPIAPAPSKEKVPKVEPETTGSGDGTAEAEYDPYFDMKWCYDNAWDQMTAAECVQLAQGLLRGTSTLEQTLSDIPFEAGYMHKVAAACESIRRDGVTRVILVLGQCGLFDFSEEFHGQNPRYLCRTLQVLHAIELIFGCRILLVNSQKACRRDIHTITTDGRTLHCASVPMSDSSSTAGVKELNRAGLKAAAATTAEIMMATRVYGLHVAGVMSFAAHSDVLTEAIYQALGWTTDMVPHCHSTVHLGWLNANAFRSTDSDEAREKTQDMYWRLSTELARFMLAATGFRASADHIYGSFVSESHKWGINPIPNRAWSTSNSLGESSLVYADLFRALLQGDEATIADASSRWPRDPMASGGVLRKRFQTNLKEVVNQKLVEVTDRLRKRTIPASISKKPKMTPAHPTRVTDDSVDFWDEMRAKQWRDTMLHQRAVPSKYRSPFTCMECTLYHGGFRTYKSLKSHYSKIHKVPPPEESSSLWRNVEACRSHHEMDKVYPRMSE